MWSARKCVDEWGKLTTWNQNPTPGTLDCVARPRQEKAYNRNEAKDTIHKKAKQKQQDKRGDDHIMENNPKSGKQMV